MIKNKLKIKIFKAFSLLFSVIYFVFSLPFYGVTQVITENINENCYEVPTKEDFLDVSDTWNDYNPTLENIYQHGENVGVRINFNGGDVGRNVPTIAKYNVDGMSLRFGNIKNAIGASGALRFTVMASENTGLGVFRVMFDTDAGTISYFNADISPVVFVQSEYLEYAVLTHGFTVTFNSDAQGNMICTVATEEETISGIIPSAYAANLPKNAESSHISIAPGYADAEAFYSFSADITGIYCDKFTRPVLATLKQENQNGKSSIHSQPNGSFPQKVLCTFNGCDVGNRLPSNSKYRIDGMTLRFDNLKKLTGHENSQLKFSVTFPDSQGEIGDSRIMFDTEKGEVSYYNANTPVATILQSDILKYANISEREFFLRFSVTDERACICWITIGSSVLRAVIPASFFGENTSNISYFAIAPGNSECYFSVCLTGIYSEISEGNYYIPDVYDFNVSQGWSENIPDICGVYSGWEKNGVQFTFNGGDVSRRISSTVKYNADGMKLLFSSLKQNSGSSVNPCFCIMFSDDTEIGDFRLLFDTGEGTVSYYNAYSSPSVIINNEKLKYAILSENKFSVELVSQANGTLICQIRVGEDAAFSGVVPEQFCNNLPKNAGSAYLQIAPGRNISDSSYYFSLCLNGISYDSAVRPVLSMLEPSGDGQSIRTSVPNGSFPRRLSCVSDTDGLISADSYSVAGLSLRFSELYGQLVIKLVGEINELALLLDTVNGELSLIEEDGDISLLSSDLLLLTDASEGGNITVSFIRKEYDLCCRITRGESHKNKFMDISILQNSGYLFEDMYRFMLCSMEENISFNLTGVCEMEKYIDNSALLPQYKGDDFVFLDENGTPEWASSLIIAEVNVETFGTFKDMIPVLDHCAETGINALWLTPIADKGMTGNGYTNLGVNTIDPFITGVLSKDEVWRISDYSAGWEVFRQFVSQAHKRNIRIFLDIVSWGTMEESELYEAHPDWYSGDSVWGGKDFDWSNNSLQDWFVDKLVEIAVQSNVDGFRYDLEPNEAGYQVNARVKSKALDYGRKLVCFSESPNERQSAYDFSQSDIIGRRYVNTQYFEGAFSDSDITDCVKSGQNIGSMEKQDSFDSGTYRYYSHALSCHDSYEYGAAGDKIVIGYQAIYAPFIPIWMIGEEFNNSKDGSYANILYKNSVKLQQISNSEKRNFFESVKKMISLRRRFSEIFEYFPDNHRDSNICRVDIEGQELSGYARYLDNCAILIIPNTETSTLKNIEIPFSGMGLCGYDSYTLSDPDTGKSLASGDEQTLASVQLSVPTGNIGVFMITAYGSGGSTPVYTAKSEPEVIIYDTVKDSRLTYCLSDNDFVCSDGVECNSVYNGEELCGVEVSGEYAELCDKYNADGFTINVEEFYGNSFLVRFSIPESDNELEIIISSNGGLKYKYLSSVVNIASGGSSLITGLAFKISFTINSSGALVCDLKTETGKSVSGVVPTNITEECIGMNAASSIIAFGIADGSAVMSSITYDPYTIPDGSFLRRTDTSSNNSLSEISKGNYAGGFASIFDGTNIVSRHVSENFYDVDGFSVRFSGLQKLDGHENNIMRFCMGFCSTDNSLPRMRIVFDADLGTIEFYSGTAPYGDFNEICRSDLLKYENLNNREFTVSFELDSENNLLVEIDVEGNKIFATVPSNFYLSYISEGKAQFFIAPANRNGFFSVKITGICHMAVLETVYGDILTSTRVPVGNCVRLPYIQNTENNVLIGWQDKNNVFYLHNSKITVTRNIRFTASARRIGDINGDNVINATDIAALKLNLIRNKIVCYNEIADINQDGAVDIKDIVNMKKGLAD